MENRIIDNNIEKILKLDIFHIIKNLYENNPSKFLEQFEKFDDTGDSFFSIIAKNNNIDKELIDFLMNKGLDFTKNFFGENYAYNNVNYYNHWARREDKEKIKNKEPIVHNKGHYSEILNSFNLLKDEALVYLLQKIHNSKPNYLKELPNYNYFILHESLKRKKLKTFSFLCSIGLDMDIKNNDGMTTRMIAEQNTETFNLYLKEYENYNGDLKINNFEKDWEWITKKIKRVYRNSEFELKDLENFYILNLHKYDEPQQEKLIASTMLCKDPRLIKSILKIKKMNFKNYKPEHYPLWLNLSEAPHQNYYYHLLNDSKIEFNEKLSTTDKESIENFFIYQLSGFLENLSVPSYYKKGYRSLIGKSGSIDARNKKIQDTIIEKLNTNFLTEKTSFKGEEINFFQLIMKNQKMRSKFINYINAIEFSDDANEIEIQEFLSETWFSKVKDENNNETNKTFIEYYLESCYTLSSDILPQILSQKYIERDTKKCIYTSEQKIELLKIYIDSLYKNYQENKHFNVSVEYKKEFSNLINNLKNDESIIWNDIHIDEKKKLFLIDHYNEEYRIINSSQLHEKLLLDMVENKTKSKNKSNKI